MPQKKKTARRSPKDLDSKKKKIQPEDRAHNILMPYLLGIVAIYLGCCFVFQEKMGLFGKTGDLFLHLFSIGGYGLPLFLFLHAIFYKRDLESCV